ncbi:peroxisome assembly protein 26 isoform X2 [Halichoeres trimaculatus]|uniref:peroxisome assembly protein 26 isoform X2 n=1 Tax=Halichoeres trimaculatus TaxID=147232 RepID=UPI003D9E7B26
MLVSGLVLNGCPRSMASDRHFSFASSASSSGLSCPSAQLCSSMLDSAAEQMMVFKDFQAALETCDSGLRSLSNTGPEDSRFVEFKAGFCILGIQALAEMNQWQKVLTWILQQYQDPDRIPAEIMKMSIVLHSKVGQPARMQDAARLWLLSPSNRSLNGFGTVAELYLLHILLPLGQKHSALELIHGDVGSSVFTEDQRRAALELLEEKEPLSEESPLSPVTSLEPVSSGGLTQLLEIILTQTDQKNNPVCLFTGCVLHKLESMLRSLYRKLCLTCSRSSSLQRLFLAAVLLYMLALRLDPALPSSFMWISKLLQLLRGVWRAMFAPYYKAQSRGL